MRKITYVMWFDRQTHIGTYLSLTDMRADLFSQIIIAGVLPTDFKTAALSFPHPYDEFLSCSTPLPPTVGRAAPPLFPLFGGEILSVTSPLSFKIRSRNKK